MRYNERAKNISYEFICADFEDLDNDSFRSVTNGKLNRNRIGKSDK